MKKEREGKERESPTQLIKISNFSHGSRVTKFRQQVNAHLAVPTSHKPHPLAGWLLRSRKEKVLAVGEVGFVYHRSRQRLEERSFRKWRPLKGLPSRLDVKSMPP